MVESDGTADATRRLNVKKQTLDDAYAVPANFLEIDVVNPLTTMAAGKKRYTDYEVRMRVSNTVLCRGSSGSSTFVCKISASRACTKVPKLVIK